ncbi:flagellar assembly protein FliH [Paludibacterium paludis]|uniref:Flagellar assembly protein FliH n=1 Tax=Paludibacterium paludis TaxID=1225769 RepID=A0A918NY47_9NEIS|nr:flagellar assembly protein FliH [Paludibacterium paludis]GGY04608.1 flagellar assembly protein FliH [Paludibacterium paludis]
MAPGIRLYKFPPLARLDAPAGDTGSHAIDAQARLEEGYRQGMDSGYREGREAGFAEGREEGRDEGRREGLEVGRAEALEAVRREFAAAMAPVDALLAELRRVQADYKTAMRREVVDLVGKVASQVVRSELALKPVQLLSLVDETLATLPGTHTDVQVFLNPEECQRIQELAPERAAKWTLIPDARLGYGECRVQAGDAEADAGCQQRLERCMDRVREQLLGDPDAEQETDDTLP